MSDIADIFVEMGTHLCKPFMTFLPETLNRWTVLEKVDDDILAKRHFSLVPHGREKIFGNWFGNGRSQ
jgi:hypothetical protein